MNAKHLFRLALLSLVFLSCDPDRFIGYNYDAELPDNSVTIEGYITELHTGNPAAYVNITIGPFSAQTDRNGNYRMTYLTGEDENLNKVVPVKVTSPQYITYEANILVGLTDISHNIVIEYGAPVIRNVFVSNSDIFLEISDFQGFNDIKYITATFHINRSGDNYIYPPIDFDVLMTKHSQLDDENGYFYTAIADMGWVFTDPRLAANSVQFYAEDYEGHYILSRIYKIPSLPMQ